MEQAPQDEGADGIAALLDEVGDLSSRVDRLAVQLASVIEKQQLHHARSLDLVAQFALSIPELATPAG